MKSNKNINFARVVWVSCLFLLLIVVLIMVMDYKINYEYNVSDRIYFYQCDNSVCTMDVMDNSKELYSIYECNFNKCPVYKRIINDDYALLEDSLGYILYNYKTGIKISEGYDDYVFINNDYIIVIDDEMYGVIDKDNNIVVNLEYDLIGYYQGEYLMGYNTSNIIARKGDTYGILNYKNGALVEVFEYTENEVETLLELIEKG